MSDNRFWLFPNNTVIFAHTPWSELPFHSLKIVKIEDKIFRSLDGRIINTKTAWDTIQVHDSRLNTPIAFCIGIIEEVKPVKEEGDVAEETIGVPLA